MARENEGRRERVAEEGLKGRRAVAPASRGKKMAPSAIERHQGRGRTKGESSSDWAIVPNQIIFLLFFLEGTFPFLSSVLKEKTSNYLFKL